MKRRQRARPADPPPVISPEEDAAITAYVDHFLECEVGCRHPGAEPCETGKQLIADLDRFAIPIPRKRGPS